MDEERYIYCEKCGSKMKNDQRCCIKCGNINFLNPDNKSMKKYAKKAEKLNRSLNLAQNRFIEGDAIGYADNAGSRTICLLLNVVVYLILVFITGYSYFVLNPDVKAFIISFLIITFSQFLLLSVQIIYMKANKRWWSAFIPFYSSYNWFDITMNNGLLFLLCLIPIVNIIFLGISFYNIGVKFNKNKLFCLFFPMIMIPYIAFSMGITYEGVNYVFSKKSKEVALAREYKGNKLVLGYLKMIVIILVVFFSYRLVDTIFKNMFIDNVKVIIQNVDSNFTSFSYSCNGDISDGVYFIEFDDAGRVIDELPAKYDLFFNKYSGYIKVSKEKEKTKYYVSMTNGLYGVLDKDIKKLNVEDISLIKEIEAKINGVVCKKSS